MTSNSVDIDHVVPLAEAWRSGASDWDDDRRGDFANDPWGPALIVQVLHEVVRAVLHRPEG
jgi:hypothetical protein